MAVAVLLQKFARCPLSGAKLQALEPWLYGTEQRGDLYPVLCKTPVFHPDSDSFLAAEVWSVARALAEYGAGGAAAHWYFSRYSALEVPNPRPIDSGVYGEGYPGFWDWEGLPPFVRRLTRDVPEDRIAEIIGKEPKEAGLDLGCGQGGMTQRMAASCDWVFGLENHFYLAATANHLLRAKSIATRYLDPVNGEHIRSISKTKVDNAMVVCGDALFPPFLAGAFDWIHCGHLFDLVKEPERLARNMIDLLKPGGWLSICAPFDYPLPGHLDEALALLHENFLVVHMEDGLPWLRYHHKRRFVLHEDWIWVGRRKG